MQLFSSLLIALIALASSAFSTSLDDHSLWMIFKKLHCKDMQSFAAAHPLMLQDHNVRALIQCKGNFVCALKQTFNSLILKEIPEYLYTHLIRDAALGDDKPAVEGLIRLGVDPKWLDYPLKRALYLGLEDQAEWIRSLLPNDMKGIQVKPVDPDASAPDWIEAVQTGNLEDVQYMITFDHVDVNLRDLNGSIALIKAVQNGHLEVVKTLLEAGADVDIVDVNNRMTPLMFALKAGNQFDVFKALIDAGAYVNANDNLENTPLMWAARYGRLDLVQLLIEAGADVNSQTHDGETALSAAAENEYVEIMNVLIEAGADVNARNNGGKTALLWAAENGHIKVVKALIEAGADVNAKDERGETTPVKSCFKIRFGSDEWTALMKAAYNGHSEVIKVLIEAGADVNAKIYNGENSLIWAAMKGHFDSVKLLIAAGAEVNAMTSWGETALIKAAKYRSLEIVKALLEAGADVNMKDENGKTALDYSEGSFEVRKELKRAQPTLWRSFKGKFVK